MANKWDERKKAQEDEYFVKKEREKLAKLKAKQEAEVKEAAKKSLTVLFHGRPAAARGRRSCWCMAIAAWTTVSAR